MWVTMVRPLTDVLDRLTKRELVVLAYESGVEQPGMAN